MFIGRFSRSFFLKKKKKAHPRVRSCWNNFVKTVRVACVPDRVRGLHLLSSLPLSLPSPWRRSDPGSPSRLFSTPPHYDTAFVFIASKTPAHSSLVDSHRPAPTHAAKRSQQVIPFRFEMFCKLTQKSDPRGIRTPEPTLACRSIRG